MDRQSRIYVAGHRGLVGSAIVRSLRQQGYDNLLLQTHGQLDLTDAGRVDRFFAEHGPDYVFLAAAKVGGILANNTYPADFIRENLAIQSNVIESSRKAGVKRLLFLGSSCIYPKLCPQPIKEEYLLTGPLEPTNRPYALAKIAGIEMCWAYNRQYGTNYVAAMPTNLYGPGDNYDLKNSHVLPALIRKVVEAKAAGSNELIVWGSGTPRRELLYSDDMAEACVFLMNLDDQKYGLLLKEDEPPLINVGTNQDVTIRELAETVCEVLEFDGKLIFDSSKPDGTPRKLMDSSRINALGWKAATDLRTGIRLTFETAKQQLLGHATV
ncbi:GDP-L-fucose synthase family protein [Acidipila rosea]|uniref:GDP-L-fucose synthase n=1 Tax=Acidipila rosea TaxID=768535 RepID=A0A4R1KXL1_9BACT|nr:GDP-L-fucose synthase [Acidipila rosea]TCK70155.1 GDP-L-fucose synthase [Acidipila rosea]